MRALLISLFGLFSFTILFAAPNPKDYPHWDLKNQNVYQQLTKIDDFIQHNQGKGYIAAFDWDGTIYSEQISPKLKGFTQYQWPGDQVFVIWASRHLDNTNYPNLYPMFRINNDGAATAIRQHALYFMGKAPAKVRGYNLFSQTAAFPAGMTPEELEGAIKGYLEAYPAEDYVFLPILDLLQRMSDAGFHIWIVTGGNPYFVSVVMHQLEKTLYYRPNQHYHFNLSSTPYQPDKSHIVGNMSRLLKDGHFSMVYDDRFTKNPKGEWIIVDREGKAVALENYVEPRHNTKTIFYAGNSDGDAWAIKYILGRRSPRTLAVAINPYGNRLKKLIRQYRNRIVVLSERSKVYPEKSM